MPSIPRAWQTKSVMADSRRSGRKACVTMRRWKGESVFAPSEAGNADSHSGFAIQPSQVAASSIFQ